MNSLGKWLLAAGAASAFALVVQVPLAQADRVVSANEPIVWFDDVRGTSVELEFPSRNGGGAGGDDVGDAGDTGGNGNNGHGNNDDGVDSSNPGQGGGGPTGADDPSAGVDDEGSGGGALPSKGKGKGK
ncbi:MAG: hypothetical protein JRG76_00560 [Deltaproteobacteria bacterium]|nr:hypothetical protein [Deltaproteobacteria bacterium]